ncbi:MAG: class I SAM-dependent rRNA methyltransferase [Myxococcota bacterium]
MAGAVLGGEVVMVSRAGANRLRHGHPWVFRTDVRQAPEGEPASPFVNVVDERRNPVAICLYSAAGPLALRRWGPPRTPTDEKELRRRLTDALGLRGIMAPGADAVRLVHGEADDLPGLFVDQYAHALVIQTACRPMERLLPQVLALLTELVRPGLVVRRDDGSARDLESLPRIKEIMHGGPETRVRYHEGETLLDADLLAGHKTGSYLDQRENHAHAGSLARGRCLDLFSNEGGFGVAMARNAEHVICVEQDPVSVERLVANARLNGVEGRLEGRCANAFDELRTLDESGARFDCIVVDPPALAKRAGPLEGALRGYFELNRRAFRLCTAGAWLITYSCSGRVTAEMLEDVVRDAASHARRRAQVVGRRFAPPDHPGLLGLPETEYLKGLVLRVF